MDFEVNVRERILKPVNEVFDAVVDPKKMSNYFISGASGPIKVGRVEWEFGDVGAKVPIDVLEVEDDRKIVLESSALGPRIRTTIQFAPDGPDATVVTITESTFPLTEEGVKRALGQNAAWTHTLCGLKAYVQFGINLRTGLNKRLTDVESATGKCL
ncbi:MAG: SRPBCC domain-containing protein [Candidatus Sulfotelmatobacter sp.]